MARYPDAIPRPPIRCSSGLAPGTVTASAGVLYEIVPVWGAKTVRVRIKTATNGGTLDFFFLGPDFALSAGATAGSTAYASLGNTIYTSKGGTQLAVTAGTEAGQDVDCAGEGYLILKFTGTVGAGAITFVDVSQL